jgi:hypothetical protein
MPYKNKEKQKIAQRKSYLKNQDKVRQCVRDRRINNRIYVNKIKTENGCKYCGENHIACLDFHHKDSSKKEEGISKATADWTLKRLIPELEKCEVVCSNCHRKLHYKE